MYKIRTHQNLPKGRIFAWLMLMLAFGTSIVYPVFPNFIKSMVKTDEYVSLFFVAMSIIQLIAALLSSKILRIIKRTTFTKLALVFSAVSLFFFSVTTNIYGIAVLEALRFSSKLFLLISFSLFVRDFTKKRDLGREEGVFYQFGNIGYLIGPLIGGFIGVFINSEAVFISASTIFLVALLYFYHKNVIEKNPAITNRKFPDHEGLLHIVKRYFSNIDRTKAYFITLLKMIWPGFKKLYIPLYVALLAYETSISGLILALGIIPLILMEVKVGEYGAKKGIRMPISIGFLIMGFSLILVFLSPYHILNFALLIFANIGNALIEPLQEYYLFEHLPEKDEDKLYGIYMTADPIAYFLVPSIGALILLFLSLEYLFLFFGGILILAGVWTYKTLKA